MKKHDLRKEYKNLYSASTKKPAWLDVPALQFLMIDGTGDPNTSQAFKQAVGTLYSVSYTLKFTWKKEREVDYPVMALEGLWWTDDMPEFSLERKGDWKWTVMIMQPEFVPKLMVLKTIEQVRKKSEMKDFPKVRLERFKEGRCAQILHVGPYSAEGPTIQKLHEFIKAEGCVLRGKHHEIYFGDPRRSAPEKLRTILRQPAA
jgi:hypothetical protein